MAIVFVQNASVFFGSPYNNPSTPISVAATGSGNLLVLILPFVTTGVSPSVVTGVVDNAGNVYTQASGAYSAYEYSAGVWYVNDIWYKAGATAGATSATATISPSPYRSGAVFFEYSGADPSSPFEIAGNAIPVGLYGVQATITTTNPGDVLIESQCVVSSGNTGTPWTHDTGYPNVAADYLPGVAGVQSTYLNNPVGAVSIAAFSPPSIPPGASAKKKASMNLIF